MATYGRKYQINFSNVDGDEFIIYILQKQYTGLTFILPGASTPFVLNYRDNGEKIYAPIKASEATIRFLSVAGFDIRSIITDDDSEFKVELYTLKNDFSALVWVGFIDSYSCSEDLLDDPKIVTLKATDGLGLLKKQEFLDEYGKTVYDKETLIKVIYYCLYKTGVHDIDLTVELSVYEEAMDDRNVDPSYDGLFQTSVHTRSFIKERDKFNDCYSVLESIMSGFNATIFQADGKWQIVRFPDRWNSNLMYQSIYLWPYNIPADYSQNQYRHIVNLVDVVPINTDHQRGFSPPVECAVVTYDYGISPEIPRNASFKQGRFDAAYSDDDTKIYAVDYWSYESGTVNTPVPITLVAPYRVEQFELDATFKKRLQDEYIVLPSNPGGDNDFKRLRSYKTIDVTKSDTLYFSVETKSKTNYTDPSSVNVAYIILQGKSGQKYTLREDKKWIPTISGLSGSALTISISGDAPAGEWRTVSAQSEEFPEDGELSFWLMEWTFPKPNETFFKNLTVNFSLYNGISGEEAKVCQLFKLKETEEKIVTIGSSPNRIVNGALLRSSDNTNLCTYWYQYGVNEKKRLFEILARDIFRAKKRLKTKIDGTIKGVVTEFPGDSNNNGIISPNTHFEYANISGYVYLPSSMEIDIENNSARLYLYEFYNSLYDNVNEEGDTQSFKYLF